MTASVGQIKKNTNLYRQIAMDVSRYKTALFSGLSHEDANQRSMTLDHIVQAVQTWAQTLQSPVTGDEATTVRQLLHAHLLVMLRMSVNCPFVDVRMRFTQCLQDLRSQGVSVPRPIHTSPSFFIPADKIIPLDTDNQLSRRIMIDCFLTNGRFSHVYRLLSYFPEYMDKFLRTHNHVLRLQGPLPRPWRHYIAIMASAQHQCQYLVTVHTNEFLQTGGDPLWLEGLSAAPPKLQSLSKINSILCHQPWTLSEEHIGALLRGADSWSKSELVQAIVLMATFYSLSSFILGCGVVPEIDMVGGTLQEGSENPAPDLDFHEDDEELLQQTRQLIQRLTNQEISQDSDVSPDVFESCDSQETAGTSRPRSATTKASKEEQSLNFIHEDLGRFMGSFELQHTDFNVKSPLYSIFRLQDYNWEEHGCSLVSKYLPETGELLDDEFSAILNLTDYSLFNSKNFSGLEEHMDTWPFRQAIWYYVLRLAGMSHDDYNYHEVNIYLNRQIKNYIKKVVCYPEKIVPSDFRMGFSFRNDEKCQINLLAAEARKCAILLYGLHAVMKYER